jgi:broad specificity phosphatase PhoE
VTDSPLTNHGVFQAYLLGRFFAGQGIRFTHIFSSDLSRARDTADNIYRAQLRFDQSDGLATPSPLPLPELREQDFGPFEGKAFSSKPRTPFKSTSTVVSDGSEIQRDGDGMETKESMRQRADIFIDRHLLPILSDVATLEDKAVAVVAHGLILSTLWRCLLRRFSPSSVTVSPCAMPADRPIVLEHLGAWSNTGYLDLHVVSRAIEISPQESSPLNESTNAASIEKLSASSCQASTITAIKAPESVTPALTAPELIPPALTAPESITPALKTPGSTAPALAGPTTATPIFRGLAVTIKVVNGQIHVRGLKRTRGGVGSSAHDAGQRKIDTFFKKQKTKRWRAPASPED